MHKSLLPFFRLLCVTCCVFCISCAIPSSATPASQDASSYADPSDVCSDLAHIAMHIHLHLSLYIDDQPIIIPKGTGIASTKGHTCYYWLHTHDTTGVIHVESPTVHNFVLGDFLDIWRKHFATSGYPVQLTQHTDWQAFVDARPYHGDFRTIPMLKHALITLTYHSPAVYPDAIYNWRSNL